jgi:Fe-S cluster assembly protein SufD
VYCTNAVTEVVLAEDAQIEHYKVQDEPVTAFHLALLDVRQGRGSGFSSRSVMLGSSIARHEVRVLLEDVGAEVSLDGVYLPQGDQLHDNTIFVDHAAANCTSHQLYKGVLDGRGHGVFNGHIMVRPGADGTDANQKNKNLILSDRAEADTRPRLEIYTDDVKCTHGAAVGQLEEDALLYMRARGIPLKAARGLLINAFVHEMVDRIALLPLRVQVEALVAGRFRNGYRSVEP